MLKKNAKWKAFGTYILVFPPSQSPVLRFLTEGIGMPFIGGIGVAGQSQLKLLGNETMVNSKVNPFYLYLPW